MAEIVDETQHLVHEADDLIDEAEAVEAAESASEGKKRLRALKNHYFDWEARAKVLVSEELLPKFVENFDGNNDDKWRIKRFFGDALTPVDPKMFPFGEPPKSLANVERNFEPWIEEQKRILFASRVQARRVPGVADHLDVYAAMFRRLPQVVSRLTGPGYSGRQGLEVNDEYDLQRVMYALLNSVADDVEREEWGERSFEKNPRLDFMVRDNGTAVEAKYIRPRGTSRTVGDEIVQDIPRYSAKSEVQSILFVIYDPERLITNPRGLENSPSAAGHVKPIRIVVAR